LITARCPRDQPDTPRRSVPASACTALQAMRCGTTLTGDLRACRLHPMSTASMQRPR
jgi:hypothetical protein